MKDEVAIDIFYGCFHYNIKASVFRFIQTTGIPKCIDVSSKEILRTTSCFQEYEVSLHNEGLCSFDAKTHSLELPA